MNTVLSLFSSMIASNFYASSDQPKYESMVSGFPEQTVERQGSLVFCVSKSSEAERERLKPLERMSVFAGNARHNAHPKYKIEVNRFKFFCLFFGYELFVISGPTKISCRFMPTLNIYLNRVHHEKHLKYL